VKQVWCFDTNTAAKKGARENEGLFVQH